MSAPADRAGGRSPHIPGSSTPQSGSTLYAGYNQVSIPERTVRAGCWAHVRRKLLGIVKLAERDVNKALMLIAEL